MRIGHTKAALGAVALATMLAFGTTANAAPISKCAAAKKKCIGKYIAAVMGCHAKAEGKSLALDPACVGKAVAKITGAGKGCFDKNDAKVGNDCPQTGDAGAQITAADAFILDVVNDLDPGYPAPVTSKCSAARKKCVGKKAAGLTGCAAKANKDGVGDPACAPKIQDKFGGAKGCDTNALIKGTDCLGTATTASIEAKVDAWEAASSGDIDGGTCGNGANDAGEDCDASASPAGWAVCGPTFTCTASCTCACPTKVVFSGDAADPVSILDTGWTGISHRAPIIANGDVTVGLSCSPGTSRPCGTCTVSGPVENVGADAGKLHTRRCSNDTSIKCTTNAPCAGGGGTCEYFFGSNLPLAAGGVGTCVVNQFNGPVTGTANVESGEATTTALLTSKVYTGPIDNPCPKCSDPGALNDGVAGGTCDSGPHAGAPCDANGFVPGCPDFGRTSLDCPVQINNLSPAPAAVLPIDLSNATDPVTKTLTAASPNCSIGDGSKCLCETCNNAAATPCDSNADCVAVGATVCGGKRCIGGTNDGGPCNNVSACPGGGLCGTAGEPSKAGACQDDTTTPGVFDCTDTSPVDGEGECTNGPVNKTCSVASGHGQRACATIADCGGGAGSCVSGNRLCFLTGGFSGLVGTNTLTAVGMEDAPMADTAHPTLGAVFCVGPTSASAVNIAAGLPGPGRVTIKGTAVGLP